MKKLFSFILALILLFPLVAHATKVTDMTAETSPASTDLLWLTIDPATTAADRKITLGNLLLWIATQDMTLTGTIDASGATVTWPATLAADIHVDDILTALGIASEAVNFGTFTGSTIADSQTAKAAMQALETALELKAPMASPTFSGTITVTGLGTGIVQVTADEVSSTTTLTTTISGGTASTVAVWDGSQNLTALSSQNVITTGYVDGGILVTKSTDATVTVTGMSGYYVNADDDVIAFNLHGTPTNKGFCFANMLYAKAITVNPDDADYIVMDGIAGEAGEAVVSTGAADEQLCVIGVDASYWKVTSKVGTWAQETPP